MWVSPQHRRWMLPTASSSCIPVRNRPPPPPPTTTISAHQGSSRNQFCLPVSGLGCFSRASKTLTRHVVHSDSFGPFGSTVQFNKSLSTRAKQAQQVSFAEFSETQHLIFVPLFNKLFVFLTSRHHLSNILLSTFWKTNKSKIMSNTSVGVVSPFWTVFLQLMAPLYMAIWQILLQNMADVGYHNSNSYSPFIVYLII